MIKFYIAVALVASGHCLPAQAVRAPLNSRYTAIGTYSKNFADAFSGSVNQATLAQVQHTSAGIYGERRFMLKELSNYTAAIVLPSKWGGFGMVARYFGGQHYNDSQIGAGYGRKLGDVVDIGVQFNYNMIRLAGYGSSSAINFEAGVMLHLTPKLHTGLHVYNPTGGKFGKDGNEKLASIYTTGIGYEVSDKFFISADISKEEEKPAAITASMQYSVAKQFFARLGTAAGTGNYFCGLGLQWKVCRADVTATWHPQLGFTPALMLLFNFTAPAQLPAN